MMTEWGDKASLEWGDRARFVEQLKKEFAESEKLGRYDADEDAGYFMEFLIDKLFAARNEQCPSR